MPSYSLFEPHEAQIITHCTVFHALNFSHTYKSQFQCWWSVNLPTQQSQAILVNQHAIDTVNVYTRSPCLLPNTSIFRERLTDWTSPSMYCTWLVGTTRSGTPSRPWQRSNAARVEATSWPCPLSLGSTGLPMRLTLPSPKLACSWKVQDVRISESSSTSTLWRA